MKPRVGKTYLREIPHEGKTITFQHPPFRGLYGSVAKAIDSEGLERPNSPKTASLVHDAFQNPEGQYESEIIKILNNSLFWEFTGNRYLLKSNEEVNNGVILEHNPEIINGKLSMDKNSLVERLQGGDPLVKFVPFGYKIGEQNLNELRKNPYIIARYEEEGAEKIVEIASKYKNPPRLWSFNSVDEEKVRLSALCGGWGFGGRLDVDGGDWGDCGDGRAFGVLK